MSKGRLEAFSDGVIAIIITIMVLELKVPHEPTWHALAQRWPVFMSYLLSFFFVGVYWTNHHHLLHTLKHVDGKIIWLNLHLLFWMSLIPFVTSWLGETRPEATPTFVYGIVMFMAGFAYQFLQRAIAAQRTEAEMRVAHEHQTRKGMLSIALYAAALTLSALHLTLLALALYLAVAIAWVLPERRFERHD
jgi:uncharacterized membrane protein